jgi:hypothetical protein
MPINLKNIPEWKIREFEFYYNLYFESKDTLTNNNPIVKNRNELNNPIYSL